MFITYLIDLINLPHSINVWPICWLEPPPKPPPPDGLLFPFPELSLGFVQVLVQGLSSLRFEVCMNERMNEYIST